MTWLSSRLPSHPSLAKQRVVPAPPPTSGPLITRALAARSADTLSGGHVWGSGLSRNGKGSARGEAEAPWALGCNLEPHPHVPGRPRGGQQRTGPGAGEALGPRRAALEPFATWRLSRGYLSSALGAPPGSAPGAFCSRRPRPPRTTWARPTRPAPAANSWVRRRLALRLPARRAPSPAALRPPLLTPSCWKKTPLSRAGLGVRGARGSRAAAVGAWGSAVGPAAVAGIRGHAR